MKYYEYNGYGNKAGPEKLQCPLCGEAAIGMIEGKRELKVSLVPNGNMLVTNVGDKINIENKTIYCPQCIRCEMIPHSEVQKYHEKESCVGCPICNRIEERVFSICRECVLSYNSAVINCSECAYNYSKTQQGIDISGMKISFEAEISDIESGHQFEMFQNARRKIYKKQKDITGVSVYEQIA